MNRVLNTIITALLAAPMLAVAAPLGSRGRYPNR